MLASFPAAMRDAKSAAFVGLPAGLIPTSTASSVQDTLASALVCFRAAFLSAAPSAAVLDAQA